MALPLTILIHDLQAVLQPEQVLLPGSDGYDTCIKRWAASIEKPSAVVILPRSSQDVSIAVKLAAKHSIPFTTVCGGHGTSGDSSITDGMLINMRRMNSVKVDTENLTLTCGGGCIWEEIDKASVVHNISSVGGTVQQTGVAGYTTGGGFGWLSGTKGLAIDNLLSAEIVLADGRIVRCSETEETDLFWAVRGAGHMFGVLTEFVFQGHHQPNPVYGGLVMFPPTPSAINHLISFANRMLAASDGRTGMMCGFATPPHLQKRIIFGCCFHDGPEAEALEIFGPLIKDESVKPLKVGLKPMNMNEMNAVLGMAAAAPGRRISKGAVFSPPLPPAAFEDVLNMYEQFVLEIPEAGESGSALFEFYPLKKMASVPVTATAFSGRSMHSNAMIVPRWLSPKNDVRCRQFARDAMDVVSKHNTDSGGSSAEYINYDGLGTPAAKTYGVNYPRLCELKARYDPDNVFSKRFGLGSASATAEPTPTSAPLPEPQPESTTKTASAPQTEPVPEAPGLVNKSADSTAPPSPPTPTSTPPSYPAITHAISVHSINGDKEQTVRILDEVRNAVSKVAGVNVNVEAIENEL